MFELKDAYKVICIKSQQNQVQLEESLQNGECLKQEIDSLKHQLDAKNTEIGNLTEKNEELTINNRVLSKRHVEFMKLLSKYMQISENIETGVVTLQETIDKRTVSNINFSNRENEINNE